MRNFLLQKFTSKTSPFLTSVGPVHSSQCTMNTKNAIVNPHPKIGNDCTRGNDFQYRARPCNLHFLYYFFSDNFGCFHILTYSLT
jgi:hypothetical protein